MRKSKVTSVRFDPDLKADAAKVMEKENRSFTNLVEVALRVYVEKAIKKFKSIG